MDVSDVALTSMAMSAAKLQTNVSLSVAKETMDSQEMAAQQLFEMLPSTPGLGQYIDVRA